MLLLDKQHLKILVYWKYTCIVLCGTYGILMLEYVSINVVKYNKGENTVK